jgi:hypothetical protein
VISRSSVSLIMRIGEQVTLLPLVLFFGHCRCPAHGAGRLACPYQNQKTSGDESIHSNPQPVDGRTKIQASKKAQPVQYTR